jgi:hypothetical protein
LSGGGVLVEWLQVGWRHNEKQAITGTVRICAPEEIRTPNLLIRSQKWAIAGYLALPRQPHLTCANRLTMSRRDAGSVTRVDANVVTT